MKYEIWVCESDSPSAELYSYESKLRNVNEITEFKAMGARLYKEFEATTPEAASKIYEREVEQWLLGLEAS